MTDLSARLRDVLSDETLSGIDKSAHREAAHGGAEYLEAWRTELTAILSVALSSLLKELEREIREALAKLKFEASAIVNLEREGLIELVSLTNVRCLERRIDEADELLSRLASSSSPAAPQEIK